MTLEWQISDTWHCNDWSFSRYDIGNGAYGGRLKTGLFLVLLTLPAMLFHTYRTKTPALGSTGLVVILTAANSAVNTAARSATARNNTQLTQIPAFMNFLSGESATSQWCQIYRWYNVATFTWAVYCGTHWSSFASLEYLGTRSLHVQWPGPPAPADVRRHPSGRTWGTRSLTRGKTLQQTLRTWRHAHWTGCGWVRDVYYSVHIAVFCNKIHWGTVVWMWICNNEELQSCALLAAATMHTAVSFSYIAQCCCTAERAVSSSYIAQCCCTAECAVSSSYIAQYCCTAECAVSSRNISHCCCTADVWVCCMVCRILEINCHCFFSFPNWI